MKIKNKRILMIGIILNLVLILGWAYYSRVMPSSRARFFNANTTRQHKELSQSNIHLAIGEEQKKLSINGLSAAIPDSSISWNVEDTTIAGIVGTSKGREITLEGKKLGTTRATCSYSGVTQTVKIYVVHKTHLNDNGGSGGSESFNWGPSQANTSNHYWKDETSSTPLTQVNVPTRSGYTFKGYYSQASGGNQMINAQGTILGGASTATTLYAQWESNTISATYTITLAKDGGTGGPSAIYVRNGKAYMDFGCSSEITGFITTPTKNNCDFKGYYSDDIMIGPNGQIVTSYLSNVTSNQTWTARWEETVTKGYTINFNANKPSGASGNVTGMPSTMTTYATNITLPSAPSLSGYKFLRWCVTPTGGSSGDAGGQFNNVDNYVDSSNTLTFYATWEKEETYTINFNANKPSGVTGSIIGMPSLVPLTSSEADLPFNLPSAPSLSGYTFQGWCTKTTIGNDGNVWQAGGQINNLKSYVDSSNTLTLYAIWKKQTVAVTGITLDKTTASVVEGNTVKLTATVTPSDATNKNVTWTSSNGEIATVDSNGTVTGKKAGTAIITVTTADGNKTATCTVTVTAKTVAVTGITLDKTTAEVEEGDIINLTSTIAPSNATNKNVTWTSSNTEIATVDNTGTVTAKKPGTATIRVTTADGNKTDTCTVTVKSKTVEVEKIEISKSNASTVVDGTIQLTATVFPENATNKKVVWESDDESVATVNQNGLVTGKEPGITTIRVTTEDGEFEAECEVTVTEKPADTVSVIGVTLDKTKATIGIGGTTTLTATVQPSNATNKNVIWSSSDESIATVTNGIVTGKKPGTATITVTTEDGTKTAKCTITVKETAVTEDKTAPVINKVEQSGDTVYVTVSDADSGIGKVTVNGKDITNQKTSDGRYWFKAEAGTSYEIIVADKAENTVTKQYKTPNGSSNNNNNNNSSNNNNSNNSNSNNNNSNSNNVNNNSSNKNNTNINNSNTNNSTNRSQQANTTDTSLANKVLPKTGLQRGLVIAMLASVGFAIFSVIKYKKIQLK